MKRFFNSRKLTRKWRRHKIRVEWDRLQSQNAKTSFWFQVSMDSMRTQLGRYIDWLDILVHHLRTGNPNPEQMKFFRKFYWQEWPFDIPQSEVFKEHVSRL